MRWGKVTSVCKQLKNRKQQDAINRTAVNPFFASCTGGMYYKQTRQIDQDATEPKFVVKFISLVYFYNFFSSIYTQFTLFTCRQVYYYYFRYLIGQSYEYDSLRIVYEWTGSTEVLPWPLRKLYRCENYFVSGNFVCKVTGGPYPHSQSFQFPNTLKFLSPKRLATHL